MRALLGYHNIRLHGQDYVLFVGGSLRGFLVL